MRRAAALALTLLAACGTGEPIGSTPTPEGPYVVTAIDYHFHDAHPSLPIATDRPVVFKNVGRNPHNVTIPRLSYARELPVDAQLELEPISEPGRYAFYCTYHRDRKMYGVLVVV
ncbi:MAG: cupredoxin domain-containing protein [Actinomycetota bacterium]